MATAGGAVSAGSALRTDGIGGNDSSTNRSVTGSKGGSSSRDSTCSSSDSGTSVAGSGSDRVGEEGGAGVCHGSAGMTVHGLQAWQAGACAWLRFERQAEEALVLWGNLEQLLVCVSVCVCVNVCV